MAAVQESEALQLTLEGRAKALYDESERKTREIENLKQEVTFAIALSINIWHAQLTRAYSTRKTVSIENDLAREEDKQTLQRAHELAVSKLRTDFEEERLRARHEHSVEMVLMLTLLHASWSHRLVQNAGKHKHAFKADWSRVCNEGYKGLLKFL